MSDNLVYYAGVARSYLDFAGRLAADGISSAYNKGVDFARANQGEYPFLGQFIPVEGETSSAAFTRGAMVGTGIILSAAAATFAINLVTTVVSAVFSKVVVCATIGGLLGLTQHFHAQLSAQSEAAAALSAAQQDQQGAELTEYNAQQHSPNK